MRRLIKVKLKLYFIKFFVINLVIVFSHNVCKFY